MGLYKEEIFDRFSISGFGIVLLICSDMLFCVLRCLVLSEVVSMIGKRVRFILRGRVG